MKEHIKFITKHGDIDARPVHPTETAGKKFTGEDLPSYAGNDGEESKFVRCKQCGFIVNRKINHRGSGYGNIIYEAIPGASHTTKQTPKNPVVGAGCPFCGSSEYE